MAGRDASVGSSVRPPGPAFADLDDALVRRLLLLADPEKAAPGSQETDDRETLTALANRHGVDNILWRKFGSDYDGTLGGQMLQRIGQAMLLRKLSHEITRALADSGVQASVVKGPVFADKLYSVPGDRLYTDIDLMVESGAMSRALSALRELGYRRDDGGRDEQRSSTEYKLGHPAHANVLIELHGDMVHYPLLRRRVAFGRRELLLAGDGDGEAAGALLATAIVHATLGHKFERLVMLVDVLQAARRLPPSDYGRFVATLSAMRLALECKVCLGLTARLFDDGASAELASLFRGGVKGKAGDILITPRAVIGAPQNASRRSWLRRKGFRLVQYLP